jgi:hypothetical protein
MLSIFSQEEPPQAAKHSLPVDTPPASINKREEHDFSRALKDQEMARL